MTRENELLLERKVLIRKYQELFAKMSKVRSQMREVEGKIKQERQKERRVA